MQITQDSVLEVAHGIDGRPKLILDNNSIPYDLSISHKDDFIGVGIIRDPHKIGIDIELVEQVFKEGFAAFFLTPEEVKILRAPQDAILFWALKESFFKALGLFLPFKQLQVKSVGQEIHFSFSNEIQKFIQIQNLVFISANYFIDRGYIIAYTIFKRIETEDLNLEYK